MAFAKINKVHSVIHASAVVAAGVGAGLAQLPGSDAAPLCAIQTHMIVLIAMAHGRKVSEAKAAQLLGTFSSTMVGRKMSQVIVGRFPGYGNAINAITAYAITEALGWAAHHYYENLGAEPPLGQERFRPVRTPRPERPALKAKVFDLLGRVSRGPALCMGISRRRRAR